MSHLPYPGRYESFDSWDYRCKEWERNRDYNRRVVQAGKGSQKYDGYTYGENADPDEPHLRLDCPSRLNRHEWALINAARKAGVLGSCVGHSLCSSCRYYLVPERFATRETRTVSGIEANFVSAT